MYLWIVLVSILILIFIFYWGIPFISLKKKGYTPPDTSQLKPAVSPVFKKGSRKSAVLLIHGFEGSPFEMKEMGEYLYSLGYTISIPLLPGHGTSVQDLIKTDFKDWFSHVDKEYQKLKETHEAVYIIGISMGGLLTLNLSQKHQPAGIVVISTPIFLNGFINNKLVITNIGLFFSGILSLFKKTLSIKRIGNSDLNPWEGYDTEIAINCSHSLKINMPKVRRRLYQIQAPICLIHSKNDHTIPINNLYYLFENVSSHEKSAYSFKIPNDLTSNHVLTTHSIVKDRVFTHILDFIKNCENHFEMKPSKLLGIGSYLKHTFRSLGKKLKLIKK